MKKMTLLLSFVFVLSKTPRLYAQFDPKDFIDKPVDFRGEDIRRWQPVLIPAVPCGTNYQWTPTENYIPVWMKDNNNNIDEDVSPLYVRRDLFTCERMIRNSNGFIENVLDPFQNSNFGTNINPDGMINSGCPEDFRKCNIGFVGVNNTQPTEQLDVIGNIKASHRFIGKVAEIGKIMYDGEIKDVAGNPTGQITPFVFNAQEVNFSGNITANSLTTNNLVSNGDFNITGKISIGDGTTLKTPRSPFSNYSLSVDGNIVCRRLQAQQTSWADKVFSKEYKLMPLSEVETYISKNKHLPEIPSEKEVIENGIDIGEMNKLLLQKVEELTLHLIEQEKKIKALEVKVSKTKK